MTNPTKIDATTQVCAVIGNPVEHSLSPAIHNAAFTELGLNFVYVAFRVEDIGAAMAGMRALGNFRGLSVTIPHKVSVMQYLDEIDEIAENIGSVNTVIKDNGRLKGTSSDGPGALKALKDYGIEIAEHHVLILGSGGAARAVSFTLAMSEQPWEITLLGVIPEELRKLGRDLRDKTHASVDAKYLDDESLRECVSKAEIIINCTPVGMLPKTEDTVVPKELLRRGQTVFDIVYTPRKTRLIREAESVGCLTVPGVEMFLNQAAIQFELWTGHGAPFKVMRKVVEENLR